MSKTSIENHKRKKYLGRINLAGLVLLIAGLGVITQLLFSPVTLEGRLARGIPFLLSPFLLIIGLNVREKLPRSLSHQLFLILAMILIFGSITGLVRGLVLGNFNFILFAGDVLLIVWILSCLWIFKEVPLEKWYILALRFFTFVALFFAGVAIMNSFINKSVVEPHPAFIAILMGSYVFLAVKNSRADCFKRWLLLGGTIGALPFYLLGYSRSSFLVALIVIFLGFFLLLLVKSYSLLFFVKWTVVITVILLIPLSLIPNEALSHSRVYRTFESPWQVFKEKGLYRRINEIKAAIQGRSPLSLVMGSGNGAIYLVEEKFFESELPRNPADTGKIHSVHIGPALFFLRYGILGIALYISLFILLIKGLGKVFRLLKELNLSRNSSMFTKLYLINYFVFIIMFVKFHTQLVLYEPLFGVSVALLATQVSSRKQ